MDQSIQERTSPQSEIGAGTGVTRLRRILAHSDQRALSVHPQIITPFLFTFVVAVLWNYRQHPPATASAGDTGWRAGSGPDWRRWPRPRRLRQPATHNAQRATHNS